MTKTGYIPKEIIIVSSGSRPVLRVWEHKEDEEVEEATPGFPVDANNKKRIDTARMWARNRGRRYGRSRDTEVEIKEEKYDNSPMTLRVVNIEYRSRGGLVFKVVDQRGYLFDLREDVLLDAVINPGVEPGGQLGGGYVWGVLGSQTRLVRYGSDLYDDLVESGKLRDLKKISLKALKPNTFYETRRGEIGLFVGFITSIGNYGWSGSSSRIKKAMLWLIIRPQYSKDEGTESQLIEAFISNSLKSEWTVKAEIKKSHNFVKEVGPLEGFPPGSGMIRAVRDIYRTRLFDNLADINRRYNDERYRANYRNSAINRANLLCNMAMYGEEPDVLPEYNL
jgi:hypothetical protein